MCEMTRQATTAPNLGPVRPDALYPLRVLKQRLGWKDAAISRARRDGLTIRRYGNTHFVLGQDAIDFLVDIRPERRLEIVTYKMIATGLNQW